MSVRKRSLAGTSFAVAVLASLSVCVVGSVSATPSDAPAGSPSAVHVNPARADPAKASPTKAKRAGTGKRQLRRSPQGYGFLPGYEAPPDDRYPDYRRNARSAWSEGRYWSWGRWYYGWGSPGFVRGRWNGGSIGPCWTWTPIGAVWNCGR
jgi:hypothetical protein